MSGLLATLGIAPVGRRSTALALELRDTGRRLRALDGCWPAARDLASWADWLAQSVAGPDRAATPDEAEAAALLRGQLLAAERAQDDELDAPLWPQDEPRFAEAA